MGVIGLVDEFGLVVDCTNENLRLPVRHQRHRTTCGVSWSDRWLVVEVQGVALGVADESGLPAQLRQNIDGEWKKISPEILSLELQRQSHYC